jgi:glycerol-3-phosphate cytidylyltransferase
LFHYDKLGITGARKQLRELFINSDQDYLIMLDDDCAIRGIQEEGKKFIDEIEAHPDQYCIKRPKLLKLLAISRSIYSQMEFPNINPEANEGYEDAIFCEMLKALFPEKEFKSASRLIEFSNSATDPNSTWRNEYKTTINRTQLSTNTRNIVNDFKKDHKITPSKKTIKTVITYGTFDILHHGHIELLRRAKEMGDRLIVGLSTDEFNFTKGKKSYYDYSKRKQMLEAIKYVDEVIPENSWNQKEHDIKAHQADIFVMGDDWAGKFDHLNSQDTQVVYLPRTPEISTSAIKGDIQK